MGVKKLFAGGVSYLTHYILLGVQDFDQSQEKWGKSSSSLTATLGSQWTNFPQWITSLEETLQRERRRERKGNNSTMHCRCFSYMPVWRKFPISLRVKVEFWRTEQAQHKPAEQSNFQFSSFLHRWVSASTSFLWRRVRCIKMNISRIGKGALEQTQQEVFFQGREHFPPCSILSTSRVLAILKTPISYFFIWSWWNRDCGKHVLNSPNKSLLAT